ncbi:hypothetical protein EJB05_00923, partial [Eragrostis curvula]
MVKKQDVTGLDTDDHGQDKLRMVKALSALPYHPVFNVSGDASSSSSPPYPRVVPQMLQFPEQHLVIYPVHPSLQSRMEGNTVFRVCLACAVEQHAASAAAPRVRRTIRPPHFRRVLA